MVRGIPTGSRDTNGILILIPASLHLSSRAQAGDCDAGFYTVQTVEFIAGALTIALLGLNKRDGRRLTGAGRRPG